MTCVADVVLAAVEAGGDEDQVGVEGTERGQQPLLDLGQGDGMHKHEHENTRTQEHECARVAQDASL